ncbi:acetyl-CoA carboxylase biotin carboxyl carrier protein [Rhodococcus aetherivorans]|uniref:acetyl-CoA carboxylase biotin carboxyl carrier protein n=1 Tax=Rhodococcus aetherivorans TaxID=191292 RepID=UPI00364BC037
MDISSADIKLILTALQDAGFDQAEVVVGDVHIAVARRGASLTAPAAPTAESLSTADPTPPVAVTPERSVLVPDTARNGAVRAVGDSERVVTSPSVGVFRRAPQSGGAPFVEVGRTVSAGDTLGIVEVSTLTMSVEAPAEGVVTAVAVDDAAAVEFGSPLVTIAS